MALQQPTRQAAPRILRPTLEDEETHSPQLAVAQPVEEPQTWVLFPPATDTGTTPSSLTSTHGSNITPGCSRFGDLGSLNTLAPSEAGPGQQYSNSFVDAADEEDDAELDSLDSHLPEFRSAHDSYISSDAVPRTTTFLPVHDGLGLFRLEEGMGSDVQNRLYAFERYNPRRVKRLDSFEAVRAELDREENQEAEKMRRIENWRLEQSRYLLDEIQKETRRRHPSTANMSNTHQADQRAEDAASLGAVEKDAGGEWHEQTPDDSSSDRDSLWSRITRKVIQDFLGIDDKMLAILVGEALPDEEDLCATPKLSGLPSSKRDISSSPDPVAECGWQAKMLERVARELGLLIHQLTEHRGGFTTFGRMQHMQHMPIPYAGLPAIPESASAPVATVAPEVSATLPEFQPTIPTSTRPTNRTQADRQPGSAQSKSQGQVDSDIAFTQEEWEQDLDIRLVFRYLRSRFLPVSSSSGCPSGTSHLASPTTNAQDAAAKVARVRQHHPLVSRSRNVERRKAKSTAISSTALFRPVSSYASQSTRRSVRRSSCSSSRHYWDIGGSVGTGSMIATTGPMGAWGEV
ncbi:hypothetical protein GGS21DRAFT_525041 [Xylaria nigripes]|nr:hypothetical protein GGS21DRAFT_525041 [Xylaria nigripes]